MKYRKFGSLDWKTSALGFGAMRLPVLDNDSGRINEPLAMEMIRHAIDSGVNYVDTAYPYHQEQSEPFIGKVLKDGYRNKVKLATKMPSWFVKEAADLDRLLEEQLRRLDVDHLDFYLLHALNAQYWAKYKQLDVFTWAEKKMAEGLFEHLCFSFHDEYSVFEEIVNGYDNWTMAQIQYNYMDTDYQAGTKGLKLAASKGLAVVVMEPLRGGRLAKNPAPPKVEEVWARSEYDWSPAAWALQWIWNQPEVSTVLSGMSTIQQVDENLETASHSSVGLLKEQDLALVEQARKAYESLAPIPCTQCEYCLPCPNGVSIPKIFEVYNEAIMYEEFSGSRWAYMNQIPAAARADNCVECGECEAACPQSIHIIDWLAKAHEALHEPQK
ncbi:MAG: aldo/keto reductase [Anaerolineaceae bacterium]|nr:aldo/keto reductase [Anaerolineaceae bacterium]